MYPLAYHRKLKLWTVGIIAFVISFAAIGLGKSPQAASIAQGYTTTDSNLIIGMAASISSDSAAGKTAVERSSLANKASFVGIVTTKDASLVTLENSVSSVYVATLGETTAYITDINGVVKKGDYVAVSPLKGILMKATDAESSVVGSALEDFDTSKANTQEITKADGGKQTVHLGIVKVDINPHSADNASSADSQRSFLQQLGRSLTGKSVSDWQVVAVLVIFMLLLVVEGSLMYGAIHSAIIAIGRNPLARTGVYKQLLQVLVTAVAVLGIGLAIVFALLRI